MIFKDSLGIAHHVHEPLLKAGIPAPAEPPPGAFRALVDELAAHRRRRMAAKVKVPPKTRDPKAERIARADHLPTVRQTTSEKPLRKSLSSLAAEARRMTAESQRRTEEIQRRTAVQMLCDLTAAAKAGRLDAISAAKVDALRHANATALGLTATGIRR